MKTLIGLARVTATSFAALVVVSLAPTGCSSSPDDAHDAPGTDGGVAHDAGALPPPPGADAGGGPGSGDAGGDGASPAPMPNELAGARLKPIYARYDAADGASWRQWEGWYDVARDEPCYVQRMSDGNLHCAPYGEELAFLPDSYFSDASCTSPIIGVATNTNGTSCSEPRVAPTKRYFRLTSRQDACAPTRLVDFPKTAPLILSQYYYKTATGACQGYPTTGGGYEIYAAQLPLVEVSPSSFTRVDRKDSTPATAARLRVSTTEYAGEDGSKSASPTGIVDSARNEICHVRTAADGVQRCMPYGGYVNGVYEFSDPSCTLPVFDVSNNGNCAADDGRDKFWSYMETVAYAACGKVSLYPRFTAGQLSTTYYGKPGACTAQDVSLDKGYTHYAASGLPAPIPPTDFTTIATATADATASFYAKAGSRLRMQQIVTTGDNGFAMRSQWIQLFDAQAKAACYPATLPDGSLYCLPNQNWFSFDSQRGNLFADAACTDAVVGVYKPGADGCGATGGLDPTAVYTESPFTLGACQAMRPFRVPSVPLASQTFYTRDGTSACAPFAGDTSQAIFFKRSALVEVQPSELVKVDVTLEK
jgi:hypothetical protein